MIKKYRKLPVIVEAMQFTTENKDRVLSWATSFQTNIYDSWDKQTGAVIIIIPTLEGEMEAHLGDYIIKGVKGELYPCKPYIFKRTYAEQRDTDQNYELVTDEIMNSITLQIENQENVDYKKVYTLLDNFYYLNDEVDVIPELEAKIATLYETLHEVYVMFAAWQSEGTISEQEMELLRNIQKCLDEFKEYK